MLQELITLALIHLVKIQDGPSQKRISSLMQIISKWRCPSFLVSSTWCLESSTRVRTASTSLITLPCSPKLLLVLLSCYLCSVSWTSLSSWNGSPKEISATLSLGNKANNNSCNFKRLMEWLELLVILGKDRPSTWPLRFQESSLLWLEWVLTFSTASQKINKIP